jgi:hypothetical protein
MACARPFRPWFSPTLRVFSTRTVRDQSTDPSLVLSCTSAPPQWLSPKLVASYKKLGRPCLLQKAPRFSLRPFSISKPNSPFFPGSRRCLKDTAISSRSPALRVWLPSRRCQPSSPRECSFNSPRSWALPSRAFFRPCGPLKISQECSVPAFSYQTLRPAPIPLFAYRSRQKAPSCSYYNRSISVVTLRLPLYETRICFCQALSSLLSPDLF